MISWTKQIIRGYNWPSEAAGVFLSDDDHQIQEPESINRRIHPPPPTLAHFRRITDSGLASIASN